MAQPSMYDGQHGGGEAIIPPFFTTLCGLQLFKWNIWKKEKKSRVKYSEKNNNMWQTNKKETRVESGRGGHECTKIGYGGGQVVAIVRHEKEGGMGTWGHDGGSWKGLWT